MSQELHYTSVPRGLKPGSRGFCSVVMTPHMPVPLVDRLEALSGYQPVFPPHDPSASLNPVVFSHLRLTVSGNVVSVLSRIGPAGLDYSGRPNKYAHHVVLEGAERSEAGPAWLLSQPSFMQGAWEGEPREIPAGRTPPQGDHQPGVATAWRSLVGDGGWAGLLAETFLTDPRRTVFLVFRPGMDLLPLFVEALALLPFSRRWDVDFSTYFSPLPQGITCAWRGVLDGSDEAKNARRLPNAVFFDLCHLLGRAEGGALVHLARTGERIAQGPGTTPIPTGSGRHIPRMPQGPALATADPGGQAGAPQPRRASRSYELVPELARLAAGGRLPDGPMAHGGWDTGPIRRRRKSLHAAVIALCLACVIVVLSVGLLLRSNVREEISAERAKNTEARERVEAPIAKIDAQPKIEQPEPAYNRPALVDIKNQLATRQATQDTESTDGDKSKTASDGPAAVPKENADTIPKPFFFPLEEPVSTVGGKYKQEPLALGDPSFRVSAMELLGTGDDLSVKQRDVGGKKELVVSQTTKHSSPLRDSGRTAELATFEAQSKNEIRFRWNPDLNPVDKKDARRSLRDCVLKITPNAGEIRYCILRRKPLAPANVSQLAPRIGHDKHKTGTYLRYEWKNDDLFGETSRKPNFERCKLLNLSGIETIPLSREEDGSWVDRFEHEILFSAKLEGSAVVTELRDNEPGTLGERIEKAEERQKQLRKELSEGNDTLRIEGIKKEIAQLEVEKSRLRHLLEVFKSFLDATITWEVGGIKLEISRVDFSKFAQITPH